MNQINADIRHKNYSLTDGYLPSRDLQQQPFSSRLGKLKWKKININLTKYLVYKKIPSSAAWAKPSLSCIWLRSLHCRSISNRDAEGIAKTEISPVESVSAPPCPTTKIHRFGWYNCVYAWGFCQPCPVNQGPHLFTPKIPRATTTERIP